MKRLALASAALVAGVLLTGCGSNGGTTVGSPEAPATSAPTGAVARSAQPASADPASDVVEPAGQPIGSDLALYADGARIARVQVMSYDPSDATATVQVNSLIAMTVNPADFRLVNADGSEVVGSLVVAAWDNDLAANDQTIGPVQFRGATNPTAIIYAPAGSDPVSWSL